MLLEDIADTFEYLPDLQRPTKALMTPKVALFINKVGTDEMNNILRSISHQEVTPGQEDNRLWWLTIVSHTHTHTLMLDILELFIADYLEDLKRQLTTNLVMTGIVSLLCTIRASFRFVLLLYASLRAFLINANPFSVGHITSSMSGEVLRCPSTTASPIRKVDREGDSHAEAMAKLTRHRLLHAAPDPRSVQEESWPGGGAAAGWES